MAEAKETCFDYLDIDDHAVFSTSERKWITRITKLKEKYPDHVDIRCRPEENHGELVAYVPKNWFKLSPPRQREYTPEQRKEMADRMRGIARR